MRCKPTGFISVLLLPLLTACSHKVVSSSVEVHDYCKLQQFDKPVHLQFENIKAVLNAFDESKATYDALWVKVTGGKQLLYCRIQIQDCDMWSWSGEEGTKPQYVHRMGYQKVEQLFINMPSAHYSEQPFANYASEPGLEAILVKKAGVTTFSYAIDRECLSNFATDEEAKIAQAKTLSDYMRKLL
jgi:hypothetical protein